MDLVREIVARDQQRRTIMMMGLPEVGPLHADPVQVIDAELERGMYKTGTPLVVAPVPDRRDVRMPPPTQTQLDAQERTLYRGRFASKMKAPCVRAAWSWIARLQSPKDFISPASLLQKGASVPPRESIPPTMAEAMDCCKPEAVPTRQKLWDFRDYFP